MTKREKILASIVAFTVLVLLLQLGFNKYQTAVKDREKKVRSLDDKIYEGETAQIEGTMADVRMDKYILRSLPGDKERALATYSSFLTGLTAKAGLSNVAVTPRTATENAILYQLTYDVKGSGSLEQVGKLLYQFHEKNALHRISNLSLQKFRDTLQVSFTVQAVALKAAPADAKLPESISPRVVASVDDYLMPILNRNPVSPPNRQPAYAADRRIEAVAGEDFTYMARFNDPDQNQKLQYKVIGELPPGLRIDDSSGQLRGRFSGPGSYELTLVASDNGWPRMSAEQKVVLDVKEPPAEEPKVEVPKFDEATQTFLTGLTQSRGDWTAMLHVRTRTKDEFLRLKVGDTFEIGQLKGTVVEVNNKYAVLESDGERFELKYEVSLADAVKNSAP